jgi:hypothetical protein
MDDYIWGPPLFKRLINNSYSSDCLVMKRRRSLLWRFDPSDPDDEPWPLEITHAGYDAGEQESET